MGPDTKSLPKWAEGNLLFRQIYKTFRMLRDEGLGQTFRAVVLVVKRYFLLRRFYHFYYVKGEERIQQENAVFERMPKISVVVPLYNTPTKFLRELIASVQAQTYQNWQLCLADGSDSAHEMIGEICREQAAQDSRIVYRKLEKNAGIAGNRNAAIEMADGDFVAPVDHDDLLAESALYEVTRAINESGAEFLYSDEALFLNKPSDSRSIHFKPIYSPDFLRGCNYICHLSVIGRDILARSGLYDAACEGSEDFDFTLRVTENTQKIHHIPLPLYYWRTHSGSVSNDISAKPYALDAARRSVQSHIDRLGLKGTVEPSRAVPMMRVIYDITGEPLVSILIPTCDHSDDLRRCIESVEQKSSYRNFEIIVCENNSRDPKTFAYYEELRQRPHIRVVNWEREFNFSAINNFARQYAKGEHLIFLNNDVEVITDRWIEEMIMFTQRPDVGGCGVKLLYPNDTVQHGGIAVGIGGSAANLYLRVPRSQEGYLARLAIASNMSACTAACLCVRADVFDEVGGFDEALSVAFNDVDLCLKIRDRGYLIVFNPVAECYHYESLSRGSDRRGEKKKRMEREKEILRGKWPQYYGAGYDPYYSPHFGKNSISYGG